MRGDQRRAELKAIAAENEAILSRGFYQHPETGSVAIETATQRAAHANAASTLMSPVLLGALAHIRAAAGTPGWRRTLV
jgi:hypothetical protein